MTTARFLDLLVRLGLGASDFLPLPWLLRSAIAMLSPPRRVAFGDRPHPGLKVGSSEGTSLRLLGKGVSPLCTPCFRLLFSPCPPPNGQTLNERNKAESMELHARLDKKVTVRSLSSDRNRVKLPARSRPNASAGTQEGPVREHAELLAEVP